MCSPFPLGSGFGVAIRNKDGGSLSQNVNTAASLARLMVYNCALLIHYCPNAAQLDRGRKFAPTIGVFERGSIIYAGEASCSTDDRGAGHHTGCACREDGRPEKTAETDNGQKKPGLTKEKWENIDS